MVTPERRRRTSTEPPEMAQQGPSPPEPSAETMMEQQQEGPSLSANLMYWTIVMFEFMSVLARSVLLLLSSLFRQCVPEPKKSVRSRIVLVTGAGHGLGRHLALNFASRGARVVLWDIDQARCEAVAEEIRANDGQAYAYKCDVSDEKQVEEVGQRVKKDVGDVHILINNAGVMSGKPIMYLNSYQIRRTLEINALAHFWTIRQFLPSMLEMGEGHIVAVASVAGILGCANLTDYCASKHAVMGLMAALREDLYSQGKEDLVNLTVACPSIMDTGMVQRPRSRFPAMFPIYSAEDVAKTITDAILRNKRIIVIPTRTQTIFKIANLFPCDVPLLLQRFFDYGMESNLQ